MTQYLTTLQIIISVVLVGLVLVQPKGTGLGRSQATSFTRRGLEKLLFKLTFVFAGLFLLVSILQLVIS